MFLMWFKIIEAAYDCCDTVAEWLRRWTANPMGSARVGSNPIFVVILKIVFVSWKHTGCAYTSILE